MLKFVGAIVVATLIAVGIAWIVARVRFDRDKDNKGEDKCD